MTRPSGAALRTWWSGLRVRHKVLAILLVVFTPVVLAIGIHVTLVSGLLSLQQQRQDLLLAREQVHILRRLAVRIEDGFRGYLLTEQESFLQPLREDEPKIEPTVDRITALAARIPGLEISVQVRRASDRVKELLASKHALIARVRAGHLDDVLSYVQSGQGLVISSAALDELRGVEDVLDARLHEHRRAEEGVAQRAFWGLLAAVLGSISLGLLGAHLLARSITAPIGTLQTWTAALTKSLHHGGAPPRPLSIARADELGDLVRAFEDMGARVQQHIAELQAISAIGHEINTIGPDGLDGVLHRITTRAAELLQVDVCLVMLRNTQMGCWVIEAASGSWHDGLHKTVMLWEEFPVSVRAFETRKPAMGDDLRSDHRPQVVRRNMIGDSMLAVPLLAQGEPFGVLVFLMNRATAKDAWNVDLATGFADEAAIAMRNARLYEEVQEKGKGLESRLRHLEHLAETLAHDLSAPGERLEGLAALVRQHYGAALDERGTRWLRMIEENGKELTLRVRGLIEVARLGARGGAVGAIDPGLVIGDILKARAAEIECGRVRIDVQRQLPLVACHRAYLAQVFDNLLSNAIKFLNGTPQPRIRIAAERQGEQVTFGVVDNGPGIPFAQRERIFEPFVRLSPDARGSGIGLTIVKRIVELYGGRIWIDEPPEGGCAVHFTLPALGELDLRTTSNAARPEGER